MYSTLSFAIALRGKDWLKRTIVVCRQENELKNEHFAKGWKPGSAGPEGLRISSFEMETEIEQPPKTFISWNIYFILRQL